MRKIIKSDMPIDEDVSLITQEIIALCISLRGNFVTFNQEDFTLLIFLFAYSFCLLIYLGTWATSFLMLSTERLSGVYVILHSKLSPIPLRIFLFQC